MVSTRTRRRWRQSRRRRRWGVTQTPALSIVKTADPTTVTAAGDTVDYSFVVTNTGNVTVTGITVTDTFTAPAGPELTVTCPDTTLALGRVDDVHRQLHGDPGGCGQRQHRQQCGCGWSRPERGAGGVRAVDGDGGVTQTPALSIVKTADPTTVTAAGDTVDYSFVVTNTGNVTVTGITVTDTFTAPAGPELTVTCRTRPWLRPRRRRAPPVTR